MLGSKTRKANVTKWLKARDSGDKTAMARLEERLQGRPSPAEVEDSYARRKSTSQASQQARISPLDISDAESATAETHVSASPSPERNAEETSPRPTQSKASRALFPSDEDTGAERTQLRHTGAEHTQLRVHGLNR
eukprot:TRINITY_DN11051_c0_g1_i6.p2 TRINITY_DN11051_c0_g1~~TRINITY_DN11051_c0_g1_i6.p2  ORF type:complete len:136 (+),score=7.53 TRINITY_DN11051_c0_g1_i6:476-883(+)